MAFDRRPALVGVEEALHRFPVFRKILSVEAGQHVNMPAQLQDFTVEMLGRAHGKKLLGADSVLFRILLRPCVVHKEVELYPAPVHVPVQVHDSAFRTAHAKAAEDMQDPDRFTHLSFTIHRFAEAISHSLARPAAPRFTGGIFRYSE